MSGDIKIESDKRTQIEAETIKAGFLDQGFINTMRFSELNGPEEYDNTHLYIDWHACFAYGLQQLLEWKEWITRQEEDPKVWAEVPEEQKKAITRIKDDISKYDFSKPLDDEGNIKTIRDRLARWNINLVGGILVYDGHTGILNGRMARDKGHKKDLLEVTRNNHERRDKDITQQKEKRFGLF